MDINQLAKKYFNGFSEISHFKENAKKTNAFAVLKLISYLTLLIPCLIGAIYLASLRGRVQKKKLLDHVDIKVDTQKKKIESKSKEGLKDQATKAPYTMMEKDIQPHIIEQIMAQIQERIKFAKERWILIERFYPFVDVVRRLAQDPKIFYLDTADVESSVKTQPDVVKVYAEDFCKKYHQCIEVMSALDKEVKECGTINEAVEELNKEETRRDIRDRRVHKHLRERA